MIKKVYLKDYFQEIGYDWENDLKDLSVVCKFTKTRVDNSKKEGQMSFGHEQAFLIKAIAQNLKAKSFFEIGTGRGTACYATALEPTIENITTIDVMSFYDKMKTAIGHRPAEVSNHDIFQLIPFEEKEKIDFKHRSELIYQLDELEDQFDFAFIDGDHDNALIIEEDYNICKRVVKDGAPIIFDDYHPDKFTVKSVVDKIIADDPNLEAILLPFAGHLFDEPRKADNFGIMIIR